MDDGLAVGEGLERGEAERLVAGRDDDEAAVAQQRRFALALDAAEQPDAVGRRDQRAQTFDLRRGAGPGDVEPQRRLVRDRGEQQVEALLADVDAAQIQDRTGVFPRLGGHVDPVGDHRSRRGRIRGPHEARVDVVQHDEVPVQPQPAALDRRERQPVAALHVRAGQHLHERQHRAPGGERQQARRDRRGEALDPQVAAVHERDQRQQQAEQQLACARSGPADQQEPVADAVHDTRTAALVRAAEHRDGVLGGQLPGDPRDDQGTAAAVVRVADVVVDRQRDPAHGCTLRIRARREACAADSAP